MQFRRLLPLLAIAGALIVPSTASAAPCAGGDLEPSAANAKQVRHATLCLLNAERAQRGLPGLREHASLRNAAKSYARLMVRKRFFDHVSPAGSTMLARIRSTSYLDGVSSFSLGENIAWGTGSRATPAATVAAWMDSAGHRANILNGGFREIGIGVATGAPVSGVGDAAATYATDFGARG